jgi:hypothetical protein
LDTDGDGIPNYKEREYGTDPNKPNYLLAYALKKLPKQEALKFKNVENFNESSKGLVDYYASLPENVRNSGKMNDFLAQILSDNIINELEKNLFYDKFVLPNLPLIFDLNWFPTREKLDKIYDINVTFTAKDDNTPIAYAELHFVPVEYHYMIEKYGMRPEDYSKVFPPDKERVYVLTPVDGKFDSLEERFVVSIKDIIGGREYKIVVSSRDLAGNERKTEIKTPYIRQFENIAKDDDVIIMSTYLLWYRADGSNWRDGHRHQPLLGEYVSNDPIVMSKHIDWATGHGIDGYFVSWSGYEEGDLKYFDSNLRLLLNNPLVSQVKIAILYESIGRLVNSNPGWNLDDDRNIEILKRDFSYIARNYFIHPSYLRIGGKPVIYFYEGKGVFASNLESLSKKMNEIREYIKKNYNTDIYLISDHAHPLAHPSHNVFNTNIKWGEVARLFDCITSYGGYSKEYASPEEKYLSYLEQGFEKWYAFARNNNLGFISFAVVGYDPRYVSWGGKDVVSIDRDPDKLKKRLELAFKYRNNPGIVWIHEFNNFFEDTQIEPTVEEGFIFFEVLKHFLQEYSSK